MDWIAKAEAWADDPAQRHEHKAWMRPSHVAAYLAGVRDSLEAAAAVIDGYAEGYWSGMEGQGEPEFSQMEFAHEGARIMAKAICALAPEREK